MAATLTPMMQQYLLIKNQHEDCLLFYRLGDFYELFFEDAITASRELELTLTARNSGNGERAPMCGVPHHSATGYINRLIERGYKVAICEQLTDPAESKGLVERDVVRIITPGTVIEESMLDDKQNNYIAALCLENGTVGLSGADVSTGEFFVNQYGPDELPDKLLAELSRIMPTEILVNEAFLLHVQGHESLRQQFQVPLHARLSGWDAQSAHRVLERHFKTANLEALGIATLPQATAAAGALLQYLNETQRNSLEHIQRIQVLKEQPAMLLDAATRANLEINQTLRGKGRRGSLVGLLDKTATAMGARRLRAMLDQPLQDKAAINARLDAVEELFSSLVLREGLQDQLKNMYDIERLGSRIAYGTVNPRDALSLSQACQKLPAIKTLLLSARSAVQLKSLGKDLDALEDIAQLLSGTLVDDPPISTQEGGIIREGVNTELDRLRDAARHGREWIAELELKEREQTGIKNLRINYNRVFGYYIEVTKSYLDQVPYRYTRKQTLANAERYVTPELKQMEEDILGADEKSTRMEAQIFQNVRDTLKGELHRITRTARMLGELDALCSLAIVAAANGYVRPQLNEQGRIEIIDGRHPVVEKTLSDAFVPNDTHLNMDDSHMLIITGPNMAGKSTYMRQVALITLMAHIGSFVPAKRADISLVDRIFTRVGASDDLSRGQSTFMVEMTEVANILRHATPRSLIILDEIGRGTATFDGLSIAWAVVEYICKSHLSGAKTLFATHYHELSELEGRLKGVCNYSIAVKEYGDQVLFLRKILRGGADKSFGIQVARLAGLPQEVLSRAWDILSLLEDADINRVPTEEILGVPEAEKKVEQLSLIRTPMEELLDAISSIDVMNTSPIRALEELEKLKRLAQRC